VFGIGATFYGTRPDPGGLHFAYHRLRCGDWWDSDQYTRRYNRFVHVRCGVTPRFASESNSEGLWTETLAYPYFAVIRFNVDPTIRGRGAPGSAIFFHSWVSGPTAGCVALPQTQLLTVLRWLKPADDPVIEIGTKREVNSSPTP
jgi:L,D-peptidoglycan transpeptidase YkuD (ErfK/YbiS/YcfS/YnhG family)